MEGCRDTIGVIINDIADPLLEIDSIRHVSCFGGTDGFVSAVASGGTPGYLYALNNGPFGTSPVFNNLAAGTYILRLQDANLCEFSVGFEIAEPDSLSLILASLDDVSCAGLNDGSIFLSSIGGTAPYQYSINGSAFTSSDLFEDLSAGIYNLQVRDTNNCIAGTVGEIIEPLPLALAALGEDVLVCGRKFW